MSERIKLVPLSEKFINQKYLSWVNDPEVTEFLEIGNKRYQLEDLFLYLHDSKISGRLNYAVLAEESNQHIGNASIYSIDKKNKKFEIGWFIGEKNFWGGHYAPMIIFYLHKIGFMELGLESCGGGVNEEHIKARMTNKFIGYSEIEKIFAYSEKQNKYVASIKLHISKSEWLAKAKELEQRYPQYYRLA